LTLLNYQNRASSRASALLLLIIQPFIMLTKSPQKVSVLVLLFSLFSCVPSSKMVYLQDVTESQKNDTPVYETLLQPDDLLSIIVASENPENSVPFNLPQIQGNYEIGNNQNGIKTYLVDSEGNIDFPVIGKIKLAGLSRKEAHEKLIVLLSEYIKNPGVNLRILNYKFSVLGEVNRPGSYAVDSERITLLEALSKAGDLTIYGKRSDILVIREHNGKKNYKRIDITKSDFINSDYYYLVQNDVVLVSPNRTKQNSSAVGPNSSVILSTISLLVTIIVLIIK